MFNWLRDLLHYPVLFKDVTTDGSIRKGRLITYTLMVVESTQITPPIQATTKVKYNAVIKCGNQIKTVPSELVSLR